MLMCSCAPHESSIHHHSSSVCCCEKKQSLVAHKFTESPEFGMLAKSSLLAAVLLFRHCECLISPQLIRVGISTSNCNVETPRRALNDRRGHTYLQTSSEDTNSGKETLVKLPILQIIKGDEMVGEFVCGNDFPTAVEKFYATLTMLEKKASADSSLLSGNYGIRNMYSEDQLSNELKGSSNYIILKLYREGCKKCALLDPIVDDLSRDATYSKFLFLQAEVSNVETYTSNMKDRLMGLRGGKTDDCATCLNSGFTDCTECGGKGFLQKGTIAAFCSACSGYKKIRCSGCGGKCYKCA